MNLQKILVFLTLLLFGCTPKIIQKPIQFDRERIALTQQYQKKHYGFKHPSIIIQPKIIVIHWTAGKNIDADFQEMNSHYLDRKRKKLNQDRLNISAHFLVDRDGTIYQLMPTNWMARHVIGLNPIAIGIENVGGYKNQENLTLAQLRSNLYLIKRLKKEYSTIQYVIGHLEYQRFRHTSLWFEKDPHYFTIKPDPGKKFMAYLNQNMGTKQNTTNRF